MHGDFFVEFLCLARGFTLCAPQTKNPIHDIRPKLFVVCKQTLTNEQLFSSLLFLYEESMNFLHKTKKRSAKNKKLSNIGEFFVFII